MRLTLYITLRVILDYKAQENPENEVLPKVVHLLIDEETNFSEEDYLKIKPVIDAVAAAASGGADETILSTLFSGFQHSFLELPGLLLFVPELD